MENSIRNKRPDLVKYLKNEEDADNYTYKCGKSIELICDKCLSEKTMVVSNLSNKGFSCNFCSDGISIPEKFGIYLFKQIGIKFNPQKSFIWSNKKRYDFYVPSLNMIIEVHGKQHYSETNWSDKFENIVKNDKIKYDCAIENNIDYYLVVDGSVSEFEWLKENYIKQLDSYFDLSNIDWNKIWLDSQSSFVVQVCYYWNNKEESETTTDLKTIFGLDRKTISKYLKIGTEVGLCVYDAQEERIKNALKTRAKRVDLKSKTKGKTTYQYSIDGKFINKFKSCAEAGTQLKASGKFISQCSLGNKNTAYGFKWSYNPPNEHGMYPD